MLTMWKSGLKNAGRTAAVAAVALLVSSGGVALAHSDSSGRKSLEGAWFVRVTLRACDTNASLGSFV